MRRFYALFLIFAVALAVPACAADKAPAGDKALAYGFLTKWVGNMPEAIKPGNLSGFKPQGAIWDHPKIKGNFNKALGAERLELLRTGFGGVRQAVGFVSRYGNILYFSRCVAAGGGQCARPSVIVFIGLSDGEVNACWGDDKADEWLSSSEAAKPVDKGYCDSYRFAQPGYEPPMMYEEKTHRKVEG